MILVDYSQVFISNIMQQPGVHVTGEVEEDLIRHMVLNTLRSYRVKYGEDYGELVICCDSRNYWRRDIFPQYKAHRKSGRSSSHLNWDSIFTALKMVKDELIGNFPYRVMEVETAEADDVIAVLCGLEQEKTLIISGDKDFAQLHKYPSVEQWNPLQKKFVKVEDPLMYKKEHIMRGDKGDGVPNFLSPDNTFTDGLRQKPLSGKKVANWSKLSPEIFCDQQMLTGYNRNQILVDLDCIPDRIRNKVITQYEEYVVLDRSKLFNYFVKNRLKNLMDKIQEF